MHLAECWIDLEDYAKEQDSLKIADDPNYKVSRLAGSTVTVERRPQPHDNEETKKLETVAEEEPTVEDSKEDGEEAVKDVPVEGPVDDKPKSD